MQNNRQLSVAIVGAGMGGLAAAVFLHKAGFKVQVFEQAEKFTRIGAGIQQSPNALKIHRAMGTEKRMLELGFQPRAQVSRDGETGEVSLELVQEGMAGRYGAPYIVLRRSDLHATLLSGVPSEIVHRNKQFTRFEQREDGVTLHFADGEVVEADMLIGADGIHSKVRSQLYGYQPARYTGFVSYRSIMRTEDLPHPFEEGNVIWWGKDRHVIFYYTRPSKDEFCFVTTTPQDEATIESSSAKGDLNKLRAEYADFHPFVRSAFSACRDANIFALYERDVLTEWVEGRVALLGDACHPLTPWLGQGATMAMEDATMLARCLDEQPDQDIPAALKRYHATRFERATTVQTVSGSRENQRFAEQRSSRQDFLDWLYGYDASEAPLAPLE